MNAKDLLKEHFYYETYYLNEKKHADFKYKHVDFNLDDRNQRFAEILFTCASVGKTLSREEKNYILGTCLARGCSEAFVERLDTRGIKNLELAVKEFANIYHNNLVSLVYEIIKACSADGEFSPDEIKIVNQIAKWVGISEKTLQELKKLYLEEVAHSRKLRKLCHYH